MLVSYYYSQEQSFWYGHSLAWSCSWQFKRLQRAWQSLQDLKLSHGSCFYKNVCHVIIRAILPSLSKAIFAFYCSSRLGFTIRNRVLDWHDKGEAASSPRLDEVEAWAQISIWSCYRCQRLIDDPFSTWVLPCKGSLGFCSVQHVFPKASNTTQNGTLFSLLINHCVHYSVCWKQTKQTTY